MEPALRIAVNEGGGATSAAWLSAYTVAAGLTHGQLRVYDTRRPWRVPCAAIQAPGRSHRRPGAAAELGSVQWRASALS